MAPGRAWAVRTAEARGLERVGEAALETAPTTTARPISVIDTFRAEPPVFPRRSRAPLRPCIQPSPDLFDCRRRSSSRRRVECLRHLTAMFTLGARYLTAI